MRRHRASARHGANTETPRFLCIIRTCAPTSTHLCVHTVHTRMQLRRVRTPAEESRAPCAKAHCRYV